MSIYQNTRPTIVADIMPGEYGDVDETNPGAKVYISAGYLVPALSAPQPAPSEPEAPAPAPSAPKAAQPGKRARMKAVAKADAEALLAMADDETDEDVKAAIAARAVELAG